MSADILEMKIDHLKELLGIEKRCFSIPWTENMFLEELENPLAKYTVIKSSGKIAGYGGMWFILDEAHITNIAVDPSYQKQGLGSHLLSHMIKKAEDEHIYNMTLEVRKGNEAALNLYKKFRFEECGIRKKYYEDNQEDAIIMWRKKC